MFPARRPLPIGALPPRLVDHDHLEDPDQELRGIALEIGGVSADAIRSLESSRLKLSRKVAEAIAFGTGVDAE